MTIPPMTIQPPPPQQRRFRPLLVLITVLIVLVCLVVAADRIGERVAEDQVANRLQTKLGTADRPDVEIEGIPFLTQVASRHFGLIELAAEQVPVGKQAATIDRLDLALRDVRVGDEQLTAGTVDGTALVGYAALSEFGGADVSYLENGRITIDFNAPVGGQTVSGTLTGRPTMTDGQFTLAEPQLRVAGLDLPQSLVDALLSSLLRTFRLPDLPFDVSLTSVSANESGLDFGLAGREITIPT